MAATPYSLRYLVNKLIYDDDESLGASIPVQSNLEKAGRAMRYATNTVRYYSPRYDYWNVSYYANNNAKNMFNVNEFSK